MHRLPRAAGLAAAACTSVLVLAGCGHDAAPADAAPALAHRLDDVDAAIDAHDYAAARSALRGLVDETAQARADGSIDGTQADAIRQAAAAVLEQLPPGGSTTPSSTPSPTPDTSTPTPTPSGADTEDDGGDQPAPKEEKPKPPKGPEKHGGPKGEHGHGHDHGH